MAAKTPDMIRVCKYGPARVFISRMQKHPITVKNILSPESNLKDRFIPDYKELKRVVEDLKRMGYRIVLTQGVYDMIHEGHAKYLGERSFVRRYSHRRSGFRRAHPQAKGAESPHRAAGGASGDAGSSALGERTHPARSESRHGEAHRDRPS
jgi:hypothetical protein